MRKIVISNQLRELRVVRLEMSGRTVKELRAIARRRGIKGYTRISKAKLVEILNKAFDEEVAEIHANSEKYRKEFGLKPKPKPKPRKKPPQSPPSPTETTENTRRPPTVLVVRS